LKALEDRSSQLSETGKEYEVVRQQKTNLKKSDINSEIGGVLQKNGGSMDIK
jgi:hypothetical protein